MIFYLEYPTDKKEKSKFSKRFGFNSTYSGEHWSVRKRKADEWHDFVRGSIIAQGIKPRHLQEPVKFRFYWDDRLDIDNHALMGKMTVDALKGWFIEDDSRKHVNGVSHEFWKGGKIMVEIEEATKEGIRCDQ